MGLVVGPGRVVGERMLNDPRVPLVSFTGGTRMGQHVAEAVGRRFGRTILELGGNNALTVMADANLDMALRAVLFGSVGTAGQRCTSTRRLLLPKSVADGFLDRLAKAYKTIRIGDPLDPRTTMGPLVDAAAVATMQRALATIREQGGEVIHGGKVLSGPGYEGGCYVEPCIVKAKAGMPIVREETFAPILYAIPF